jgi:hypothetical protein
MAFRLLICGSSVYVQKKRLYASSAPPSLSTSTCSLLAGACADTSLLLGVLSTVVVATDEDMLAAARQAKDGVLLVVTARRKSGTYRTCPLKVPSSLQVRWLDPESGPWPHILGPCAWRLLDCHSIHHAHLSSNLRIFHQYYSHRIKKTRKGRGVLCWASTHQTNTRVSKYHHHGHEHSPLSYKRTRTSSLPTPLPDLECGLHAPVSYPCHEPSPFIP